MDSDNAMMIRFVMNETPILERRTNKIDPCERGLMLVMTDVMKVAPSVE